VNFELTGKKLSRQAWGIIKKIREVDSFLRNHHEYAGRIRESHPEICFYKISAGKSARRRKPKRESKKEKRYLKRSFLKPRRLFLMSIRNTRRAR